MKQRYSENFLFPQGAENFGRSLVFPQGQLHGLGMSFEKTVYTNRFLFPQGGSDTDQGETLMFPQGQLHGLGSAMTDALAAQAASYGAEAQRIAAEMATLQSQLYQGQVNNWTLEAATALLKSQGYYQPGMTPESIAATAHALNPDVYVSGAGTGYGTAGSESNPQILAKLDQLNQAYQDAIAIASMSQQQLPIVQAQDEAAAQVAAQQAADQIAQRNAASAAATAAAAAAAATAAVTTNPATVTRTTTTVATTTAPPPATNVTYVLDFYNNQFWLKRSDGVAIANGSADWKSAALLIAPYNIALANVTVTPAAAAKFASNNATVTTGTTATSTGVTATSAGTQTGVATTTTTNQTTGTTTVTNTATGVTATTNPVTGTTTVSAGSDTGKLALYALLGVLLLRGAVR